jgi:hypothetical protein
LQIPATDKIDLCLFLSNQLQVLREALEQGEALEQEFNEVQAHVNGISIQDGRWHYLDENGDTYNMGPANERTRNSFGYENDVTVKDAVESGLNVYVDEATGTPVLDEEGK